MISFTCDRAIIENILLPSSSTLGGGEGGVAMLRLNTSKVFEGAFCLLTSMFQTPCCGNKLYRCRFCHDEKENHTLRRDDVTQVNINVASQS